MFLTVCSCFPFNKYTGTFELQFRALRIPAKKLSHYTPRRRLGEEYSSYSFSTSVLDGGEWSASRPGRALPLVPIGQEVGWATEPVWTQKLEEKFFRLCRGSNLNRPVAFRNQTRIPACKLNISGNTI
jgi:hypothetical protein